MRTFSIYMTGVGGQGIGLISEIVLRAADHAGFKVKSVDTHGLAQRGGIVVSQLRIGDRVNTPLIPEGEADLVIALERHEALRGMNSALADGGSLVYYDTVWQPLEVRLNEADEVTTELIARSCQSRKIAHIVVATPLDDVRMQNIAVLREINARNLIPGIGTAHYRQAMTDLMSGSMLNANLALFDQT